MLRSHALYLAGLIALLGIAPARAVDLFTFRDLSGRVLAFAVPETDVNYQSGCKCGKEDATRSQSFEPLGRREKGRDQCVAPATPRLRSVVRLPI